MTYTAKYAHNQNDLPGSIEIEADNDDEAITKARQFVEGGFRNGTWINMSLQRGAFAAVNEHGIAVGSVTRY